MKDHKKIVVKIREAGKGTGGDDIPAVVYGAKRESTPLSVNKKEFTKLYSEAGESTLITLEVDGKKESISSLVYDIQRDPTSGNIIHVDFFEPNLKEEVEAEIQLNFIGESPAVKEVGGTLVKNIHHITVKALPANLPHELDVDLTEIKTADDVFNVGNLKIDNSVEVITDKDTVIAMVSKPENVDEELEKPIEEGGDVEVVGEKEKEEKEKEEEAKE